MDHDHVAKQRLAERYLLDELDPEARNEFEEHFFECSDCALDVRAGSEFVTRAKFVLAEDAGMAVREPVRHEKSARSRWFSWFSPAYAVPALLTLLAVLGYQNMVTYPRLRTALQRPQILPWATVTVGTWGSSGPTISVEAGKGFLLFVRIPPEEGYSRYVADLYNPAGKLESSLTIPTAGVQDQWPLLIPEANRKSGNYRISVRGITDAGQSKDLGSTAFTLQVQN
jgi:hypothetical protein